jgi:hypothetical protein
MLTTLSFSSLGFDLFLQPLFTYTIGYGGKNKTYESNKTIITVTQAGHEVEYYCP